jgi:hypothetical protein
MDTWQDEQIKRMQVRFSYWVKNLLSDRCGMKKLGGNAPFREFIQSYAPADQGGYKESMSAYDTYHCWAATQYREKVCRYNLYPSLLQYVNCDISSMRHWQTNPGPRRRDLKAQ